MGYCYAFGGNIWPYLSLSDIFSISLGDVSYIYLIALPGAVIPFFIRASTGAWTRGERIEQIEDAEEKRSEASAHVKRRRRIYIQDWAFVGLMLVGAVAAYLTRGIVLYFAIGVALALTASNVAVFLLNSFEVRGPKFIFGAYFPMVFVLAVFIGMQVGDIDARRSYTTTAEDAALCGSYAVLRPFSPFYLAVGRDNRHYLIDQNCKAKFLISRSH